MRDTPARPAADAVLLEVDNLQTGFRTPGGYARAVDGVSFRIRRGETYALVGESGCGKSVCALSILRLVPAPAGRIDAGAVRLEGTNLLELSPAAMRAVRGNRISMIFQEPMTALNPVFTVGEQVAEGIRLHQGLSRRDARLAAVRMLEHVGIPDAAARADTFPHQLSGGMRQRVMIAMALACRPDVLIADEPTTALDVTIQSQILDLIRRLRSELDTGVLLITHDMGVVSENADRVGVMYAGRLVEEAPRRALFERPAHPYTRLLLAALPAMAVPGRRLATIPGRVPPATAFPSGCRFHNRCPHAFERCRREAPPDYAAGDDHRAACFLLDPGHAPAARAAVAVTAPELPRPRPGDTPLLDVRDLSMHFPIRHGLLRRETGRVRAVDGVSFAIARGESLALVGESGCGKTTVGKCLVRLLTPSGGAMHLDGADLARLPRRALKPHRRRLQMIFQDPFSSLDPRMRVGDTLLEGMLTHGIGGNQADRVERMEALLERVGLARDAAGRYPHEFSGGQRQRLGIARALAVEPDLVVCDEATSSLDISAQAQILNLLAGLRAERQLGFLFISHDLAVVRHAADRVAVMYLGRFVETGPVAEVLEHARHPYTRALLAAVPRIDAGGRPRLALGGDVPSPANPPPGCRFHPRCPYARPVCRERLPELARGAGAPAAHLAACHRQDELT